MDELLKALKANLIKDDPNIAKYQPWQLCSSQEEMAKTRVRATVKQGLMWIISAVTPISGNLAAIYSNQEEACQVLMDAAEADPDFDKALETVAAKVLEVFPCQ